jgi:hypothetical protein
MGASSYSDIKSSLRSLYLEDPRPWLVGFSGSKDSTMLAARILSANLRELNRLRELEEEVAREKAIDPDTLRRMVAKVEEYSESHRAHGLPNDLLDILKDDLADRGEIVLK